jgi:hypothetical protein
MKLKLNIVCKDGFHRETVEVTIDEDSEITWQELSAMSDEEARCLIKGLFTRNQDYRAFIME